MSRNILILSDSLAGPLFKKNKILVSYTDTWPYLLKKKYGQDEVAQNSIVSATMIDLIRQAEYWQPFFPDITIVQAGLNDCQPRILRLYEKYFLSQYVWGKKLSDSMARRGRMIRRFRDLTYSRPEEFRLAIKKIGAYSPNTLWLSIICHPYIDIPRLPNLRKKIEIYNSIIKEEAGENYIDLSDLEAPHFTIDHLHLSPEGHKEVFARVQEKL
jgi:lysophospholipase L1-like esterase